MKSRRSREGLRESVGEGAARVAENKSLEQRERIVRKTVQEGEVLAAEIERDVHPSTTVGHQDGHERSHEGFRHGPQTSAFESIYRERFGAVHPERHCADERS